MEVPGGYLSLSAAVPHSDHWRELLRQVRGAFLIYTHTVHLNLYLGDVEGHRYKKGGWVMSI